MEETTEMAEPTVTDLNILNDFTSWFWETNVLDLKSSWYKEYPSELSHMLGVLKWTSMTWLEFRPQYHEQIRNLSLSLEFDSHIKKRVGEGSSAVIITLPKACEYLLKHLANLKSIILFIAISEADIRASRASPASEWILAIRRLSTQDEFEIRYGYCHYPLDNGKLVIERSDDHSRRQKCLEVLLTPDNIFKRNLVALTKPAVMADMEDVDCEMEAGLGWMEFEDGQHEIGTFLLVNDSNPL